jgi:S1-C subfamily serine protease
LLGGTETVIIDGRQIKIGGDVIIGADSLAVKKLNDLVVYIERNKKPSDIITFRVLRDQQEIGVQLTLGERPLP